MSPLIYKSNIIMLFFMCIFSLISCTIFLIGLAEVFFYIVSKAITSGSICLLVPLIISIST